MCPDDDDDDPDLFDYAARYPHAPGFKEGETSREAAEAMEPLAGRLRKLVYDFICRHPGHTADEIAAALDESVLTIRPRVSELRCRGWIMNQGRGVNRSGKEAHRWIVAPRPGCDTVSLSLGTLSERTGE